MAVVSNPPPLTTSRTPHVLVADDERVIRDILTEFMALEGYVVRGVEDGQAALEELRSRRYDALISDLKMPGLDGLQLLDQIAKERIDVTTVIMTGFGTVETAIEALKRGAHDYILKPFKIEEVVHVVRKGLELRSLRSENMRLKAAVTLYEVSQAVATCLDVGQVLHLILKAVVRDVGADVAGIYRLDEDDRSKLKPTRVMHASNEQGGVGTPCPVLNGIETLGAFERSDPVLTHGTKTEAFIAEGPAPVSLAAVPVVTGKRLIGVIGAYSFTRGRTFEEGSRKLMSILATRAAASLEATRLYDDLLARNRDLTLASEALESNFRQTIVGFATAIEESDRYTRGHSERVSIYAGVLARGLGMSDAEVETIEQSGLLHDIGKIGIKTDMLNKPGKLTPREIAIFQEHPDIGKRILEPIRFMKELIPGVWCHHEHVSGRGYPQGLEGNDIPLLGRIIGIADAYDAMTSDRAYRRALTHAAAVEEIERCTGSQFDAELAPVFLRAIDVWRKQQDELGEPYPY